MSQMVDGQRKTFIASETAQANLRWYVSDGTTSPPTVSLCGASTPCIGVNEDAVVTANDKVTLLLTTASGTRKMVAAGVITGGSHAYAAADGEVAGSGTVVEGVAMESSAVDQDILEVMATPNTDISAATTGTTAATFEVDSDSAIPKIGLGSNVGGTGDFTTWIKPEAALAADNTITCPESDGDVLAAVGLAQTLTNKTLTAPVVTGDAEGVPVTKVVPFIENATNTVHTGTVPIPAGATILNIQVVNTVLLGATSAALIVGDDDDPNGYFDAVDCKATDLLVGEVLQTADDGCWGGAAGAYLTGAGRRGGVGAGDSGPYYGAGNNIIGEMTVGTPAATTGRTFMIVTYVIGETIAAVATGP